MNKIQLNTNKRTNIIKNINANRLYKIILSIVIMLLILMSYTYAETNYFYIEIPKGFAYAQDAESETKLIAAREDGKLNFNIQMFETEEYYEYTEESLKDLIELSAEEMTQYTVGKVSGEITEISKYPCYNLNYSITAKNTSKTMHIRQIYIYEDTYTYIITVGGETEELIFSEEIEKTLKSFKLEKYERENVKSFTKEELEERNKSEVLNTSSFKDSINGLLNNIKNKSTTIQIIIYIAIAISVLLLISIILKLFSGKKSKNQNKNKNKSKNNEDINTKKNKAKQDEIEEKKTIIEQHMENKSQSKDDLE